MTRNGKLIQMQHSCHHVDTIRNPNSRYKTTKLYGMSTCGCNKNTIFSERAIFAFPTVDICRARWPGSGQALVIHAKVETWLHYFSCLTISVLQACGTVITEYGIPSDFVRKSTVSLQIKILTAQLNFSNRNIVIILKVEESTKTIRHR